MRNIVAIFVLLLLLPFSSYLGQQTSITSDFQLVKKDSTIQPNQTILYSIIGGTVALVIPIHLQYVNQFWWKNRQPFHFAVDNDYAKKVDKLGHWLVFNRIHDAISGSYRLQGCSEKFSLWAGFFTVTYLQTLTEYHEGRSPYFGWDWYDWLAGVGGAGFGVLQGYYSILDFISFKWSFNPRPSPTYDQINPWHKDYQNQINWINFNIGKFISDDLDGLSLALGFNLTDYINDKGEIRIWLSPDFDWRVIKTDIPILRELLRLLNSIKFFTPAINLQDGSIKVTSYARYPK